MYHYHKKLMAEHLRNSGIKDEQIIEMDFEKYEFGKITGDSFYKYVKERILPDSNQRMYLFLMRFNVCLNGKML